MHLACVSACWMQRSSTHTPKPCAPQQRGVKIFRQPSVIAIYITINHPPHSGHREDKMRGGVPRLVPPLHQQEDAEAAEDDVEQRGK